MIVIQDCHGRDSVRATGGRKGTGKCEVEEGGS